jgi:hypothetical protein
MDTSAGNGTSDSPVGDVNVTNDEEKEEQRCSSMSRMGFLTFFFIVVIPMILPVIYSPPTRNSSEITSLGNTEFVRDSYYNDYLDDLVSSLNSTQEFGYLSSRHVLDPQAKALSWLRHDDDNFSLDSATPATLLKRYAAAVFYFSTRGDEWDEDSTFLSDLPVCSWGGGDIFRCDSSNEVIGIKLSKYGILRLFRLTFVYHHD